MLTLLLCPPHVLVSKRVRLKRQSVPWPRAYPDQSSQEAAQLPEAVPRAAGGRREA